MPSVFDANMYDNFFGLGGDRLPNGKKKSSKSGHCDHCDRNHSVDFVHDVMTPVVGVALLGFTLGAFSGFFQQD